MRQSAYVQALRERLAGAVVRRAGWPLPQRSIEPFRDFALYSMGIGGAHLNVGSSGESDFLCGLDSAWSDRTRVTVFDVGGYAGEYSDAARSAFGTRAHIHCFEPNPVMFEGLAARSPAEGAIKYHPYALGHEAATAPLFLDRPGSSRASLQRESFRVIDRPATESFEVAVKTLDEVAASEAVEHIDLLKVDVEGHELSVLQGAAELLARNAIDVIQFEFGEANLASRTYLRDFSQVLGSRYDLFRLTTRGPVAFEYRTKHEVFALETNYLAIARGTVTWPVSGARRLRTPLHLGWGRRRPRRLTRPG